MAVDRDAAIVNEHGVWTPGSVLVERYEYVRTRGKTPGVQWCVHVITRDGVLSQLSVFDTRRQALEWAARNV